MLEKFEQHEQDKKYTLPDKNIIGAEDDSIIRKKMGKFMEGLESEGLSLPVELQGGANDLVDRREFAIHYPVGDLFISYIVTLHEFGHLRQFEANKEIEFEELERDYPEQEGKVIIRDAKHRKDKKALEVNATKRGWDRAMKFAPEFMAELENRFQEYKKQGKLEKFEKFKELFDYFFKTLGIMEDFFFEQPKEREMDEEYGREVAQHIKKDPNAYEFFSNPEIWRVGEKVDKEEIKNFIKKVAVGIADEKYN